MPQRVYALKLFDVSDRQEYLSYRNDPALLDLRPHRVNGASNYLWHLFGRPEDPRPILK